MQVFFSENVCEYERIGCHDWGGGAPEIFVCRSATGLRSKLLCFPLMFADDINSKLYR